MIAELAVVLAIWALGIPFVLWNRRDEYDDE